MRGSPRRAQDFYRLKTGSYEFASEIFPLGGQRGQQVDVSVSGVPVKADLDGREKHRKPTSIFRIRLRCRCRSRSANTRR